MTTHKKLFKSSLDRFKKRGASFFSIFGFATIFVLIPYETLRGGKEFVDLQNNVLTFSGVSHVFEKSGGEIKGYISNEVLWDITIRSGVRWLSIDVDTAFHIISFISIVVMAAYVNRAAGVLWMLFLFNPIVIDFVMSQSRLSFAMSLFYGALLSGRKMVLIFSIGISIFIHSAMIPIWGIYCVGWRLFRLRIIRKKPIVGVFCLIGVASFLALLMGPLKGMIIELAGADRRYGGYNNSGSSLLYSLFWVLLFPIFAFLKPSLNRASNSAFATSILCVFSATAIFDLYGIRFIAAGFPAIVCGVYKFDPAIRNCVAAGLLLFIGVQFVYWL